MRRAIHKATTIFGIVRGNRKGVYQKASLLGGLMVWGL